MTAPQRTALSDKFAQASRLALAEPVAVVGVGCRFPGGVSGPESYWELLTEGRDAVTEIPPERWDADEFYDPDPNVPGRMVSKWGGFLSDVAGFDAEFFGITPKEAEAMDPQQRVLLEVAWDALEHAGIAPDSLGGTQTGVMMGVYYNEYQSTGNTEGISAYSASGNAHSITVGRIAYLLGLRGPAIAVDTACSSSLVAVHLACQSLRLRETDLALAGGVSLMLRPETQVALSSWGMFSPEGRCKSFDAGADGFVRGEGCGVAVLKRLTDAVRDGDRVLAVVRGSAVNQDGRSNGMTAPNAPSQVDVIASALRSGDMTANSVSYVETHGTGTALGDPIEFEALASTYGQGEGTCALGAVKSNLGHLEAAAGIAGFIKATLALQRGRIPRNLHFSQWNPSIDAAGTRLYVPTQDQPWPASAEPRRAGVSGFGFGGTNAHVVLEQGPDATTVLPTDGGSSVSTLVVSGKSPERVQSSAAALASWLADAGGTVPLRDIAQTLNQHRTRSATFGCVVARDRAQAAAGLAALAAGESAPGVVAPRIESAAPGVVFVYSGQGSQWAGMGARLLVDEPAFAAAVAELEPVFVAEVGFSLLGVLAGGESVVGIERIQPVLVGVQLALTALWRSYGVEPDALIGHSMGEVTAAVVSGALSVAQGLRVIATRSRLMSRLSGQGAMALVELDAEAAEELLTRYPHVGVAVHASARQTVIAGPPDDVDAVCAEVEAGNRLARRVDVDVASHHGTVDPILEELRASLLGLTPVVPRVRLISTVSGPNETPTFDADYWVDNLRNPVRFRQAVASAGLDHATFVEISPHPLLTHALTDTLTQEASSTPVLVTSTMNRDDDPTVFFHTQLATLRRPAADAVHDGRLADLPTTPWHHSDYWMADRSAVTALGTSHPLLGTHVEMPSGREHVWQADVGTDMWPWLADHKVHGQPVLPAAAFAEIALAAGAEALQLNATSIAVRQLEIEQMLRLDDAHTRITTHLVRNGDNEIRVEIHSRTDSGAWQRHAVARIDTTPGAGPADSAPATEPTGTVVPITDFYAALRETGQHHGPAFAALTRIVRPPSGAIGRSWSEIAVPDEAPRNGAYRIHPVMLDAALQGMAAAMPDGALGDSAETTYLPVSFDSVRVFGDIGRKALCRAELASLDDGGAGKLGALTLFDLAGNPVAEVTGIYVRRVERRSVPLPLTQKTFEAQWRQSPISTSSTAPRSPAATAAPGSWLLLAGTAEMTTLAEDFARKFSSPTRRIVNADLTDEGTVLEAFADAGADPQRPPLGIVIFVGQQPFAGDADSALRQAQETVWSIIAAVRAVVGGWHGKSPRLWLVTRGGLIVDDGEVGEPAAGALRGLVRVLGYEHSELQTRLVDLDGDPGANLVATLTAELDAPGTDDVVAWRGASRSVERLTRATLPTGGDHAVVRADGSYIVTGGLGGLGLVVARWLVERGAGRIVLNGRSEPSDEQLTALSDLQSAGDIALVRGDIAADGVAQQLVAAAESTGLPLRGVLHSAAVIDDGLLIAMSRESLDRVWLPKATGALRLHQATTARQLDWWVGFSSLASLLGSPGQGAYAAANAWLDALVGWRRAAGLAATTINWGQWAQVGAAQSLSMTVLDPMAPSEGIEALEAVLAADPVQIGVARLRLDRALAAFPEIRGMDYFANVVQELDDLGEGGDWPGPESLSTLEPAEAREVVADRMRTRLLAIMGYPAEWSIDVGTPVIELGIDSLMAVRLRNAARADFGVEPSVSLLLQGASLRDITAELIRQLGLGGDEADGAEERADGVRDRAQQRAAARQGAALRRKRGQRA